MHNLINYDYPCRLRNENQILIIQNMYKIFIFTVLFLLFQNPVSAQLGGCKEILSIKITSAPGSSEVESGNSKIGMKVFGGHAESEFFMRDVMLSLSSTIRKLVGLLDRNGNGFFVRIFVREAKRSSENVTINGSVGKLSAILDRPALKANEKCPVVIICHGFSGTKNNANEALLAKKIVDSGKMAAVRFDFNGHGESDGQMVDMTVESEIEDAKCVWRWVAGLPFVDRQRIATNFLIKSLTE